MLVKRGDRLVALVDDVYFLDLFRFHVHVAPAPSHVLHAVLVDVIVVTVPAGRRNQSQILEFLFDFTSILTALVLYRFLS